MGLNEAYSMIFTSVRLWTGSGSGLVLVEPSADATIPCWSKVSQSDPHQTTELPGSSVQNY